MFGMELLSGVEFEVLHPLGWLEDLEMFQSGSEENLLFMMMEYFESQYGTGSLRRRFRFWDMGQA